MNTPNTETNTDAKAGTNAPGTDPVTTPEPATPPEPPKPLPLAEAPSGITVFKADEIAEFGNKLLRALVVSDAAVAEAEKTLNNASKLDVFVDVEMTKAALFLQENDRIDLLKIYGNKNDSAVIYRALLTEMGVLKRIVTDDDKVIYEFTDPLLAGEYNYNEELKKKDETEYNRRSSRRNALNIRLNKIIRAAVALYESGTRPEHMVYKQDTDGSTVAVITKGPDAVKGEDLEIVLKPGVGKAGKAKGATHTASLNGLAKLADSEHREKEPESKSGIEGTTLKDGETSTTNSEENFLATANTLIRMINGREKTFSDPERTVLKNILTTIKESGIK